MILFKYLCKYLYTFLCLIVLLTASPCLQSAQAKTKFKPFVGNWELETKYGILGYLSIDRKQKKGIFDTRTSQPLKLRIKTANKLGTVIKISGSDSNTQIKGKLLIDRNTYKVIAGYLKTNHSDKVTVTGIAIPADTLAAYNAPRKVKAVLKLKPGSKRIAKVGKGFLIHGQISNRGPAGLPTDKIIVFIAVPDTLSSVDVVTSNRMSQCGSYPFPSRGEQVFWCLAKSLGPGKPKKASLKLRIVPSPVHFSNGGKFIVRIYTHVNPQDNVISVSAIDRKMTVAVKGEGSAPSPQPTNQPNQCYIQCFLYGHGCYEGEHDRDCCSRCKRQCGFSQTTC